MYDKRNGIESEKKIIERLSFNKRRKDPRKEMKGVSSFAEAEGIKRRKNISYLAITATAVLISIGVAGWVYSSKRTKENVSSEYKQEIASITSTHTTQMDSLSSEHNEGLTSLTLKHKEELKSKDLSYDQRMKSITSRLTSSFEDSLNAKEEVYASRTEEIKKRLEASESRKSAFQDSLASLESRLSKESIVKEDSLDLVKEFHEKEVPIIKGYWPSRKQIIDEYKK